MPELNNLVASVKSIEGWLTDNEIKFLYLAARKFSRRGRIVEIGSWKGRSTISLAMGSKHSNGNKVYAIDPHIGSRENKNINTKHEFKNNIKKFSLSNYVAPLFMKSDLAARKWRNGKKISLLWIDGSHEYEDVKKDFVLWEKFLIDGGMVAFHDSFFSGPSKVIDKYVIMSGNYSKFGHVDYITFAVKGGYKNRIFAILYSIYFKHFLRNIMRSEGLQPALLRRLIKNSLLKGYGKLKSIE